MSVFSDPWQPSGRSTWPDAGNDAEHGYMKLPGRRTMIKIRQTIYEDPGNPFQDELDKERAAQEGPDSELDKALPQAPDEVSPTGRSFFEVDMSDDPFKSSSQARDEAGRSLPLEMAWTYESSETSPTARSFRVDSIYTGSTYDLAAEQMRQALGDPQRSSVTSQAPTQHPRREYHRSMSLALPSSPPLSGEYVSPRRFWRRENSLPLMKEGPEEEKEDGIAPKSARDTRFYGFYEDLMKAYKRQSKL